MLATILGYFGAGVIYSINAGTAIGFLLYLPGALVVGWLAWLSAKKVQAKIDAQDHASTFD